MAGAASAPEARKGKVAYATFTKWKTDMDKNCQTVIWLACDTELQAGKRYVTKLRCSICTKFRSKIVGRRILSEAWITRAESIHNSNICDHVWSDQHECVMNFLKREQAAATNAPVTSYAPIVQALSIISEGRGRSCKKIRFCLSFD